MLQDQDIGRNRLSELSQFWSRRKVKIDHKDYKDILKSTERTVISYNIKHM